MVLRYKMTHPPISCEKSFESSYWRVGTFTYSLANYNAYANFINFHTDVLSGKKI